ncbi:serine hydrolase [Oceanicoccus sp. KOV_DT_Chl]|uniref:serine hydrolase domain-containing protein n=1 Tax=Oceanicoccus sp. KOV_DT_Chl TaxID=1904639 RepID=UPI000C797609|nr:serine hydrolase domain-containing protein [Oceanicoccus sp. KOV_DT_Chl]
MQNLTMVFVVSLLLLGCGNELPLNDEKLISDQLSKEELKVIESYRLSIPSRLSQEGVTALAVVLVNQEGIIWKATYGEAHFDSLFSIQSMSKTFTSVAVLNAVEGGLLSLDTPVVNYLPEFTVQDRYSQNPLKKMTLRHLLNHTAGFTHEAPVGNNYDTTSLSFEDHIASIRDTWLMFPASSAYSYSNLGVDLAAYIIEQKSGKPFHEYLNDQVFKSLKMYSSTANGNTVKASSKRIIGNQLFMKSVPVYVPMVGAGGIYTTIDDIAPFIGSFLQVKKGIVTQQSLQEMYTPSQYYPYGLGVTVESNGKWMKYGHNGGGFGFTSGMHWIPDKNIGVAILTNYGLDYNLQSDLTESLMLGFIEARDGVKAEPFNTKWPAYYQNPNFNPSEYKSEYAKYIGNYHFPMKGYNLPFYAEWIIKLGLSPYQVVVDRQQNNLAINGEPLFEYMAGVFFTSTGEALDFRSGYLIFRGIEMDQI